MLWALSLAILCVMIGSSLVAGTVRCFASDYLSLAASLPDDSYYYLLPAFRFPEKGFFTFDGIHATSGFQPLWELSLAGSAFFIRDKETFLRAALFSNYLLRALAALALFAAALHARPRKADPPNFVAGLCAAHLFLINLPFREASTSGMENSLYACLLACALWWLLAQRAEGDSHPRRAALAGLGLGCIAIARIGPTPTLVILAIGWMAIRRNPRLGRWLGLGFALPVVAWSCYALVAFGRILPMSGSVKLHETWEAILAGQYWNQVGAIASASVRYVTPEDRIGAWDAGLLGYMARASVTEVDGLANDSVFRHYRAGRTLIEYLQKEKIRYFIDILEHDGWFGPRFSHFEILHRLDFEPAETPRIHGYYIGRVTDAPFPALSASRGNDAGSAELALWTDPPVFGRARTRNLFLQPGPRGSAQAVFVTAGRYRSLVTLAGIWDGAGNVPAGACARIEIRADGQIKFARSGDFSTAIEVLLDLTGVDRVVVLVDGEGCATIWNSFSLADIRFLPVPR